MNKDFLRRALDVNWKNLALGHDVRQLDHGTFVRNPSFPTIYDANFIHGITASTVEEIDVLLALAAAEYAHAERITFRVDPLTPSAFEARLALDGYSRSDSLLLVLDGPLQLLLREGSASPEIVPVRSESLWGCYSSLKRLDWEEFATKSGLDAGNLAVADGLAATNRAKCPPVEYCLAIEDGRPVGFCNAWSGIEGVGQVEDLFVLPDARNRGVATALIERCVASLRARGIGPIVIVSDPNSTTRHMYARLGWRPLAVCHQYSKPAI